MTHCVVPNMVSGIHGFTGPCESISYDTLCSFLESYGTAQCSVPTCQLVGCAALLMDALNFGGPDGVGESGVKPRRSLRQTRAS